MRERDEPDIDEVRKAMREHDERAEENAAIEEERARRERRDAEDDADEEDE
jgi:hypothetical protein